MGPLAGRTVLVTGAGGFIGRHLADRLVAAGASVIGWVRREGAPVDPRVRAEVVDVASSDDVRAATAGRRFDAAVHLASSGRRLGGLGDVLREVGMTANVLEAARSGAFGRLICFGSADQYGAADPPQSVETPTRPVGLYGLAKTLGDALIDLARRHWGEPVAVFRPFSVYGEGQPATMLVRSAVLACLDGHDVRLAGDGTQVRDFVYVGDVCDAVLLALERDPAPSATWNLGTGRGTEIADLAERVRALAGARVGIARGAERRDEDPPALVADVGATARDLGWRARTDLDDGLQRVIEDERRRRR